MRARVVPHITVGTTRFFLAFVIEPKEVAQNCCEKSLILKLDRNIRYSQRKDGITHHEKTQQLRTVHL